MIDREGGIASQKVGPREDELGSTRKETKNRGSLRTFSSFVLEALS